MRKKLYGACIDCGSLAEEIMIDEVKPVFREEIVHYPCGAVLRSTSGSQKKRGSVSHEGCNAESVIVSGHSETHENRH